MSEPNWYEKASQQHMKYMNQQLEEIMPKSNYLAISAVVLIIVGIICTILYFTKWKKE